MHHATMRDHFFGLLSRTWASVVQALGTTTLSIIIWSFAVPVVIWVVTVAVDCTQRRRSHEPSPLKGALGSRRSAAIAAGVAIVAWIAIISAFGARTVYRDHCDLIDANSKLVKAVDEVTKDRDAWKKKSTSQAPPAPPCAGQRADLDVASVPVRVAFQGDPFPVGYPAHLNIVWHNYGPGNAANGRHVSKIFILPADDIDSQKKMIEEWKRFATTKLAESPGDPLFHANTDRNAGASSDEIVDSALHNSLWLGQPQHLFIVSLVQFTDGAGDHEAHACKELTGIRAQELNWLECPVYVTPVDIPKRLPR